jgi:glycosyltransferase involved in cell wall biosynthesis
MKDAELRRSMGEAGCSRAAREFSEEAYFAEVAKLFERVLAADKSLPPSQS